MFSQPTRYIAARSTSTARLTTLSRHFSQAASRMAPTPIAIVAGVGPGTGGAVAKLFAKKYPVALLARSQSSIDPVLKDITAAGGKAVGIPTDISSEESVKAAFSEAASKLGGADGGITVAAAVFNVGGQFARKPFLELTADEYHTGFTSSALGAFHFAHAALPLLLEHVEAGRSEGEHPPTLIFTGATASVKGSARFAGFASAKFALRAMAQSLAREFGPKGVHVAHAIIDGVIETPRTEQWKLDGEDAKIKPEDIAESYWALHTQRRTGWTWEVDMRPWIEHW